VFYTVFAEATSFEVMKDRRSLERFKLKLPARIELVPDHGQAREEALSLWTTDICAGGAFFSRKNSLSKGTRVKIDLVLPIGSPEASGGEGANIKVGGLVCRSDAEGMAIHFNENYQMTPLNRRSARDLLKERETQ
jgi:hypothetical protein